MVKKKLFLVVLLVLISTTVLTAQTQNTALIGTWSWVADHSYLYIFFADGQGRRGFPGEMETFNWSTSGNLLQIGIEQWTFTITENTLTIVSRQVAGMAFSYLKR